MAEKYIRIRGKLVAVSEEVYYAYYHMGRQHLTQAEKDSRRKVASYDALDTDDSLGVDLLVDEASPGVEETVISHILTDKLHRCLTELPEDECELISALYLGDLSERQLSKKTGIPRMTLHDKKLKALGHLKKLMDK